MTVLYHWRAVGGLEPAADSPYLNAVSRHLAGFDDRKINLRLTDCVDVVGPTSGINLNGFHLIALAAIFANHHSNNW
jgi:hypothetical protein